MLSKYDPLTHAHTARSLGTPKCSAGGGLHFVNRFDCGQWAFHPLPRRDGGAVADTVHARALSTGAGRWCVRDCVGVGFCRELGYLVAGERLVGGNQELMLTGTIVMIV